MTPDEFRALIAPVTARIQGKALDAQLESDLNKNFPAGGIKFGRFVKQFDGRGAGCLVYGADTAHSPTVSSGRALVLYLPPQGAIEFAR